MIEIFLYALAVMCASLIGVLFVWGGVGKKVEKNLNFLVSFSAGVFLVVTYLLASETLEEAESIAQGLFWIIVGVIGIWLLFQILPEVECHHDEVCNVRKRLDPRRILISDGIHNVADGILLAVAFIVSSSLGAITALSIFIHELLQEISEFFILKEAGYSTKKALGFNFLVSGSILIGALGGYFLIDSFTIFEIPLLGIAAGTFLVVVLYDLIPHSLTHAQTASSYLKHIAWFALGVLLMLSLNLWVAPAHGHEDDHSDTEEIYTL